MKISGCSVCSGSARCPPGSPVHPPVCAGASAAPAGGFGVLGWPGGGQDSEGEAGAVPGPPVHLPRGCGSLWPGSRFSGLGRRRSCLGDESRSGAIPAGSAASPGEAGGCAGAPAGREGRGTERGLGGAGEVSPEPG